MNSKPETPVIRTCCHYTHGMVFVCQDSSDNPHYHCISCGQILSTNLRLRLMGPKVIVHRYRYGCRRLLTPLMPSYPSDLLILESRISKSLRSSNST